MTPKVLLQELARFAYVHRPEAPFTLSSGLLSPHYIDCRAALSRPHILKAVGNILLGRVPQNVDAVGGLTQGADPIAMAISMQSCAWPEISCINWFSVRKEPKDHGVGGSIVGAIAPGQTVVIVDDVVTSGGSTIKAIRACREFGCKIRRVLVLVDRGGDGLNAIQRELDGVRDVKAPDVTALYTLAALTAAAEKL